MKSYTYFLVFLISIFGVACTEGIDSELAERLPENIDFNHHVRPILSDRCYACHGPDNNKREADLRLDTQEGALKALTESGHPAFVSGSLRKSAAWERINETDPEVQMPPPESNLTLSPYEIALLGKWIEQGAEWKDHWAYIPPQKAELPQLQQPEWVQTPVDHFILAQLEQAQLTPSSPAKKERLLRRVTFDLTGLPPTMAEIDAFLADESPDAYKKVVHRLLKSDAYAERMTMEWMDVARYADSHGMHADGWRLMWPWRDWVIESFRRNQPYNEFILWQLAGDMLPNATDEQKLATAFHRNHPMTAEGGVVEEEFRLEYVFDRTNTTATAFMGLTMECARCHDHKFDPISQDEYFSLSAFFNNVKELGMTGDDGNYGPMMAMMNDSIKRVVHGLDQRISAAEADLKLTEKEVKEKIGFIKARSDLRLSLADPLAYYPLNQIRSTNKEKWADANRKASVGGEVELVEGVKGKAFHFDNDYEVLHLQDIGNFEWTEPFSVSVWVHPEKKGDFQTIIGNAGNKNNYWRGWDFYLDTANYLEARLIHSLPHNYVHVRSQEPISVDTWTHVAMTWDGSGKAEGLELFIAGKKASAIGPI